MYCFLRDPLYRVRQFFRAVQAVPLTPPELERIRTVLNDDAFALYQTMPPGDQRHSLSIFDALRAQGHEAPSLLQAALLHDVAKRDVGLVYRTGVILLNKLAPNVLEQVASSQPHSWRYPFYLSLHHPELGAQWAQRAEVHADAVTLIRAHQTSAPGFKGNNSAMFAEWHRALKQLDDVH